MHQALDRLGAEKARAPRSPSSARCSSANCSTASPTTSRSCPRCSTCERADVEDEKAKQALTEAATRLALIAKIHRKLHDPAGAQLRFGPFMEDLCRDVLEASGAQNVVCMVSAADAEIPPDKLIPVALIVTELISNALEHGFAGRERGTIRIDFTPHGGDQVLTVADDGNGLPDGFSLEARRSLGLRIVQSLARQIDATFAMEIGRRDPVPPGLPVRRRPSAGNRGLGHLAGLLDDVAAGDLPGPVCLLLERVERRPERPSASTMSTDCSRFRSPFARFAELVLARPIDLRIALLDHLHEDVLGRDTSP